MSAFQAAIERRGQRIFELVDQYPESIFSKAGFYQRMMAFSMRDEAFKVQMFRFVDVLASLRRSDDIVEHLREYFHGMDGFVPMMQTGLRAAGIFPWLTALVLRRNVSGMARQFIAGKDGADVMKTLRKKRRQNIGFTVDLLGEAVVSEKEADEYAARAMELLETLARETRGWTDPLGKSVELFPVVNLSLKISAFYSQMDPAAPEEAIAHLAPKLRPILRRAKEVGAFVNFDMESYAQKNSTLDLFKQLFTEPEFADWPHVGIVIQAYLRDAERDLRDLIDWGRRRGTRFAVRLVKGAYWDYEKIISQQNGWLYPVFLQKPESDANFETCTRVLLDNESIVTAAFGSHNVRSIAHAMSYAEEKGIDKSRFEFQLLYGMAGPIKRALVEMGYRVREYSPVGELLPGMSYLVRRLLENTSNEGFLRAKFAENISAAQLLRDPNGLITDNRRGLSPIETEPSQHHSVNGADRATPPGDSYENAPLINFVHPQNQEQMRTALRQARAGAVGSAASRWKRPIAQQRSEPARIREIEQHRVGRIHARQHRLGEHFALRVLSTNADLCAARAGHAMRGRFEADVSLARDREGQHGRELGGSTREPRARFDLQRAAQELVGRIFDAHAHAAPAAIVGNGRPEQGRGLEQQ